MDTVGLEVRTALARKDLPRRRLVYRRTFPSDPADRLITATALVLGCPLVTADERIRAANVVETIW